MHYSARKLGVREDELEDVSSWIFLKWAEKNERSGNYKGQTVDQAVIDYLRGNHADPRLLSYDQKLNFNNAREFDSRIDGGEYTQDIPVYREYGTSFKGRLRVIFYLYYQWGFFEAEIGNCVGIGASRVSQELKRIQKIIHERAQKEERELQGETKTTMEELLSRETEANKWGMEHWEIEEMERQKPVKTKSFTASSF